MKTITLRNIDDDLKQALLQRAEKNSSSLNSVALAALREAFGLGKPSRRRRNSDLEKLAGSWSREDADEFDKATASTRSVDEDLWR